MYRGHSYYLSNATISQNSTAPGLHPAVLDPNISSQVNYKDAYRMYGDKLEEYALHLGNKMGQAVSFYGLIPVNESLRFMSCEGTPSILDKIAYVEGSNPMSIAAKKSVTLGGVSFWSLQQDLPFSDPHSLLHAVYDGFKI